MNQESFHSNAPLNAVPPIPVGFSYAPLKSENSHRSQSIALDSYPLLSLPSENASVDGLITQKEEFESEVLKPPAPCYPVIPKTVPPTTIERLDGELGPVLCSYCGYQGKTIVSYEVRKRTYGFMVLLCCISLPLSLVPLCFKECQYAVHKCTNCSKEIFQIPPCQ